MKKLNSIIDESIAAGSIPGLQILVLKNSKMRLNQKWGKTWAYYDLASLTKVIFTVGVFQQIYKAQPQLLKSSVSKYLKWIPDNYKVSDLLSHSSGLAAHQKLYLKVQDYSFERAKNKYKLELSQQKVSGGKTSNYSDLGFLVLGFLLEEIFSWPLLKIWESYKEECLPETQFHFRPIGGKKKVGQNQIAPSEKCPWRKKTLQGEVGDENAWAMGGVAPHAGLFGRMDDLKAFIRLLKTEYEQNPKSPFFTRAYKDWTWGWMLPAKTNSTAGSEFSKKSLGHLAFTGPSIWYDPVKNLAVGVLTNRTYPNRNNKSFNSLRPQIHDWAWRNL